MATLQDLMQKRIELTVSYFNTPIHFAYWPAAWNDAMMAQLGRFSEVQPGPEQSQLLNELLASLIADWEITDNGETVPVRNPDGTPGAALVGLPVALKINLITVITEHAAGNPLTSGSSSVAGSQPEGKQAKLPTGTPS